MNRREKFEQVMIYEGYFFGDDFRRFSDGAYLSWDVRLAWGIWQATLLYAADRLEPLAPEYSPQDCAELLRSLDATN